MEKVISLESSIASAAISEAFVIILSSYPEIPLNADKRIPEETYKGLQRLVDAVIKTSPPSISALISGTEEQIEALGKIWSSMRDKVLLTAVLSRKGGMLEDEDGYQGTGLEFRMITAGRGMQGISQPIALLQINTRNVYVEFLRIIGEGRNRKED